MENLLGKKVRNFSQSGAGFTLIELLVVIAIIGILSGIGVTTLYAWRVQAQNAERVAGAKTIQIAMDRYYQANGRYPYPTLPASCTSCATDENNGEQIDGCVVNFNNGWDGLRQALAPYIKDLPNDPLDVSTTTNNKYHWHVIVSSPKDKYQHYIIVVGLEKSGSEEVFDDSGMIRGNIYRQAIIWGSNILGSISYHSDSAEAQGNNQTCNQIANRAPLNGMNLYCGKIDWDKSKTSDSGVFESGTYYNYCIGNIYKLPSNPVAAQDDRWCGELGYLERRVPDGRDCPYFDLEE